MKTGRVLSITFVVMLLAANGRAQTAPANAAAFPIPAQIPPLSDAVTPREYAEAARAIRAELAKPDMKERNDEGPGMGDLDWISAAKVPLGALGNGLMVYFGHSGACGNGGCPMWLLLPDHDGFKVALPAAGWGYSVKSSGQAVPDLLFYWSMGASEIDVTHFSYVGGKFTAVTASPETCGGEGSPETGDCAGMKDALENIRHWTTTPAEYKLLAQQIGADSKATGGTVTQPFDEHAHAVDLRLVNNEVARVVGVGDCTRESNCVISIYGCNETYPNTGSIDPEKQNLPTCRLWPMLTGVRGWGVANVSDWKVQWIGNRFGMWLVFVVARHAAGGKTELVRYSAVIDARFPIAETRLSLDSCEEVAGNGSGSGGAKTPGVVAVSEAAACER